VREEKKEGNLCTSRRTVPTILHEMRSSISHRVDFFEPLPDFPIAFASVRQTRREDKHRYRCPLRQTISSSDKGANSDSTGIRRWNSSPFRLPVEA